MNPTTPIDIPDIAARLKAATDTHGNASVGASHRANFVTHAPSDLASLLAHVAELEKSVEHWKANHDCQLERKQKVSDMLSAEIKGRDNLAAQLAAVTREREAEKAKNAEAEEFTAVRADIVRLSQDNARLTRELAEARKDGERVDDVRMALRDFDNAREAAQGAVPAKPREFHAEQFITAIRAALDPFAARADLSLARAEIARLREVENPAGFPRETLRVADGVTEERT